jgi:hypothetical protein
MDHRHDTRGIDHSCWKCNDPARVEIERAARVEAILNAPANPHYAVEETWRDKMAAILTPAYIDPLDP